MNEILEYIGRFPPEVQVKLMQILQCIQGAAPHATPCISYQMPTFKQGRNLVHFAAYARHIGFYPSPGGITPFADELTPYKCSKGAIQFPLDREIPLDLIRRITEFRVQQELERKPSKA